MRSLALGFSLILALAACGAAAQENVVVNGGFDTDLSGWLMNNPGDGTLVWDSLDTNGNPSSGSALLTETDDFAFVVGLFQCVPVLAGAWYDFGAKTLIPSGQVGEGYTYLTTAWRSGTDCSGTGPTPPSTPVVTTTGAWQTLSLRDQLVPAGTQSIWFEFELQKTSASGQLAAHYADAFATRVDIFVDGFETGTTSAWSASFP